MTGWHKFLLIRVFYSSKQENPITKTREKKKSRTNRSSFPKDKATVKIKVEDDEKANSNVRTEFTVILPAPIPLLTTTELNHATYQSKIVP